MMVLKQVYKFTNTCIDDLFGQHFRGHTVLIWADCATPGILPKLGKCIRLGTNVTLSLANTCIVGSKDGSGQVC